MKYCLLVLCWLFAGLLAGCGGENPGKPDSGFEEDGNLLPPDFWDPGDKPGGNCSYGYGESCPQPEVDCSQDPCFHGVCIVGENETVADYCLCDQGYAGLLCDQCAVGYLPDGLECSKEDACQDSPCVYGTCRVQNDQMSCDCYSGYSGELCDECDEGYHVENLECVPD